MRKNNTAIIFGSLFFSCSVMAANGTLAPTVVPMVNGGQASIAISNTSPNLFTVPGDRIMRLTEDVPDVRQESISYLCCGFRNGTA